MGVCNSTNSGKRDSKSGSSPNNQIKNQNSEMSPRGVLHKPPEKKFNPHSLISEVKNQIMIKHINDINGDAVKINKCENSTVIIMDYSAQVIINECKNCNFFIAPCKGSISIRKSEGIRIISASQQFRCSDVSDIYASLFCLTEPSVEKVKDFRLGCFYFMYTELPDLFVKAELSVWDNSWSEFHDYTPNNDNISYFDAKNDENFMNFYEAALKDQEISVDQYYPVPFTFGLSKTDLNKNNSSYKHMFVFFRENSVDVQKIYELLNEGTLLSVSCSLVKTASFERSDKFILGIQETLKKNKKKDKAEFFNLVSSSNQVNNNNFGKSNGNDFNQGVVKYSSTFTGSNGFVFLWLIDQDSNFARFTTLIENEFDNLLCLAEDDLGKMEEQVKKTFTKFDLQ